MIKVILFDLDGVLVQTEKLKALAYAKAIQRIRRLPSPDFNASNAYREVVGAPREIISTHVMKKMGLEEELRALMTKYRLTTPQDALTALRYEIYYEMVGDSQIIRDNQWPYTVDVLKVAKENGCLTGLATLSKRKDVTHVVNSLNLKSYLDVVITAEDVTKGKPDPQIYLLAAQKLGIPPKECLVLEDSVNGIKSGLAAGMSVVAIATPFTKPSIFASKIIEKSWIVRESKNVAKVVQKRIQEHNRIAHS
jgi:beta-phosphoglucomutase-like phosphatase (HAD superfamily)